MWKEGISKSCLAKISDGELSLFNSDFRHHKYDISVIEMTMDITPVFSYNEFLKWADDTILTREEWRLEKITSSIYRLPEHVVYEDGILKVNIISSTTAATHLECIYEIETIHWILETFEGATYAGRRNAFILNDVTSIKKEGKQKVVTSYHHEDGNIVITFKCYNLHTVEL